MAIYIRNLRKEKPTQPYHIKVCRPSILGNPFLLKNKNDKKERDIVCDKYEEWFDKNIVNLKPELNHLLDILRRYGKLELFCWCVPKRCHAEIIKMWLLKNDHSRYGYGE